VSTEYERIYLAPNRSVDDSDEMEEHKKLVATMKQIIIGVLTKYITL
jgi:hypothetical protein